jgi:FkbM family methyltransferase
MTLQLSLRTGIRDLLRKLGWRLSRLDVSRDYELKRLKFISDLDISVLIDVGANTGQYARHIRKQGYRGSIHSFEPFADAFSALEQAAASDAMWNLHHYALGDYDGQASLHISSFSPTNSLLQPTPSLIQGFPKAATVASQSVQIRRLDTICDALFARGLDRLMLKIDTQGSELSVLKGAADLLPEIRLLELELSFAPVYVGQPLFDEVYAFLRSHGFRIIALEPGYSDPLTEHVLQVDAILLNCAVEKA